MKRYSERLYPYSPFYLEQSLWVISDLLTHDIVESVPLSIVPTDRLHYWIDLADKVPSDANILIRVSAEWLKFNFSRELSKREQG